jgi:hypothetical protein
VEKGERIIDAQFVSATLYTGRTIDERRWFSASISLMEGSKPTRHQG